MRTQYIPDKDKWTAHYGGADLSPFKGTVYQEGYGLGGLFSSLAKKVLPVLTKTILPTIKSAGKTLVRSGAEALTDVISGEKDIASAFRERGEEGLRTIGSNVAKSIVNAVGSPQKTTRKRRATRQSSKKTKRQRKKDIFD